MIDGYISWDLLGRVFLLVLVLAAAIAFAGGAFLMASSNRGRYRRIHNAEGKFVGLVDEEETPERLRGGVWR